MAGSGDPSERELYDKLRDHGLSHSEAVRHVLLRRQATNAPPEGDDKPGTALGTASAVTKGITLGLNDEIAGISEAVTSGFKSGAYAQGRDQQRAYDKGFAEEHPKTALAAEVAGSLPWAAVGGAAPIRSAAALGATAGFGNAEGDVGDQVAATAKGAAIGGAIAGAIPLAGAIYRGGRNVLGIPHGGADVQAERMIGKALTRGKKDPGEILAAAQARPTPTPSTLLDDGGQPLVDLVRQAETRSPNARKVVTEAMDARGAAQRERIEQGLGGAVGHGREDVSKLIDDMIQQQRTKADPLYQKAYTHGTVDDPQINALLQLEHFQEAAQRGERIAQLEGKALGKGVQGPRPAPTVESLDYLKRGLDDMLARGPNSTLGNAERRALRLKKNEMLGRLDQIVPDYGIARGTFEGDAKAQRAVELGQKFLKGDADKNARLYSQLSTNEQELAKLGAVNAVLRRLDALGDRMDLTRFFEKPAVRSRLAPLFKSQQEFEAFQQSLGVERGLRANEKTLGATGARTAAPEDESLLQSIVTTKRVVGPVAAALTKQVVKRAGGLTPEVADAIAARSVAGAKNPQDLETLLTQLQAGPAPSKVAKGADAAGRLATMRANAASRSAAPQFAMPEVATDKRKRYDDLRDRGYSDEQAQRRVKMEFAMTGSQ